MTGNYIKPIFIFSLPRSGSTLLQRILSNHPRIHTVSEPWILLPLFGPMTSVGTFTEYSHHNTTIALNEFYEHLPNYKEDVYEEIRKFTLNLYQKICSSQKSSADHFLDKTPRYHCILDHIHHTFPQAKSIYLMRDPLAVVASMLRTEPKNIWNLYFFNIDLFKGLNNLVESQKKHFSTSIIVNYENLLKNPEKEILRIFDYLEIEDPPYKNYLEKNYYLRGSMGDRIDRYKENELNLSSLKHWEIVINNPVRKLWCKYYIQWIGKERLNLMGYDMDSIIDNLYKVECSFNRQSLKDIFRILFGVFYSIFEYTIVKRNLKHLLRGLQIGAKT